MQSEEQQRNRKRNTKNERTANCWMCWKNSKLFYKQITKYKQKKCIHKIRKKQNQKAAINNRRETIHLCTTVFNYPCFQQYYWVEKKKQQQQ